MTAWTQRCSRCLQQTLDNSSPLFAIIFHVISCRAEKFCDSMTIGRRMLQKWLCMRSYLQLATSTVTWIRGPFLNHSVLFIQVLFLPIKQRYKLSSRQTFYQWLSTDGRRRQDDLIHCQAPSRVLGCITAHDVNTTETHYKSTPQCTFTATLQQHQKPTETTHLTFDHNFGKCRPIYWYKILSLSDSWQNFVHIHHKILHLTLNMFLHYLMKLHKYNCTVYTWYKSLYAITSASAVVAEARHLAGISALFPLVLINYLQCKPFQMWFFCTAM